MGVLETSALQPHPLNSLPIVILPTGKTQEAWRSGSSRATEPSLARSAEICPLLCNPFANEAVCIGIKLLGLRLCRNAFRKWIANSQNCLEPNLFFSLCPNRTVSKHRATSRESRFSGGIQSPVW